MVMNTNQINYLNIGLMFLSAVLGFTYPFETFLFVYTVLGPLHYLTEISWLHERNYYTKGRYDYLFLIGSTKKVKATTHYRQPSHVLTTQCDILFCCFFPAPLPSYFGHANEDMDIPSQ